MSVSGKNSSMRSILRVAGPLLIFIGVVILIIAMVDFFSAFGFCLGLYPGAVIKSVLKDKKDVAGSLDKLADIFEEELKNIAKSVSQILEIVLMLLIGSGTAFFFISYFSLLVD